MIVEGELLDRMGDTGQSIFFSKLDPRWTAIAVDITLEGVPRAGVLIHVPGISVNDLYKDPFKS